MDKISVFLSFKFRNDNHLRGSFYSQANRGDSRYRVADESMHEDYPTRGWLNDARERISRCDIMIVLVGRDTHSSSGVEKEVTIANQLGKPIFQIRPKGTTYGKVQGAGELISWDWGEIDRRIAQLTTRRR